MKVVNISQSIGTKLGNTVGTGLVNGQKYDKDVMALYESLKGPKL